MVDGDVEDGDDDDDDGDQNLPLMRLLCAFAFATILSLIAAIVQQPNQRFIVYYRIY